MAQAMLDPDWPGEVRQCLSCGYSMRGLGSPCTCPECGFEVDDRAVVLHGVLNSGVATSPLRVGLWILIFAGMVILAYTWTLILLFAGWLITLMVVLGWGAICIFTIATSRRERAGRFVLIFTRGGFMALTSLDDDRPEGRPTPWSKISHIKFERVSPVWRKLVLRGNNGVLLNAGVKCPEHQAERVFQTLETYRLEAVPDQAELENARTA